MGYRCEFSANTQVNEYLNVIKITFLSVIGFVFDPSQADAQELPPTLRTPQDVRPVSCVEGCVR